MRNIDDSIWRDEWFAAQDILARLLWIGLISRVADDQGRFLDNADLVKSDVFPMDKISAEDIDHCLTFFCVDNKIMRYASGGKKLIQVLNWWKYQSGSSWMAKSKYAAPEGWEDHYRYHGKGRIPDVSPNWSLRSGLPSALRSGLPSDLEAPLQDQEVKENENVKENEKDNVNAKTKPLAAASKSSQATQYFVNSGYSEANRVLIASAGLSAIPSSEMGRLDSVYGMISVHGAEKCQSALTECRQAWVKTPKKTGNGGGFYSVLNFGWVDWAGELLSTGVKHWESSAKLPETVPKLPPAIVDSHGLPVSF